jgi:hypothetical protein
LGLLEKVMRQGDHSLDGARAWANENVPMLESHE